MEEHLYSVLSAALSFPIKWGVHPSDTGLPRTEMHVVTSLRDMHLQGTGLVQGRIQLDTYGETFAEAVTAARLVRSALEGYQGGPVQGVFLESIRDTKNDDAGHVPGRSLTFSITYQD
jgi:hypothetical protein